MSYCTTCDRLFWSSDSYKQHLRNSSKHYACAACDRGFLDWNGYTNHVQAKHPKRHSKRHSKQFHCRPCDRKFASQNALNDHFRSYMHLACSICSIGFEYESGYALHKERCHKYSSVYSARTASTNIFGYSATTSARMPSPEPITLSRSPCPTTPASPPCIPLPLSSANSEAADTSPSSIILSLPMRLIPLPLSRSSSISSEIPKHETFLRYGEDDFDTSEENESDLVVEESNVIREMSLAHAITDYEEALDIVEEKIRTPIDEMDNIIKTSQYENYRDLVTDEDMSSLRYNASPKTNVQESSNSPEMLSNEAYEGVLEQYTIFPSNSARCDFIVAPSPSTIFQIPDFNDVYVSPAHSPSPARSPMLLPGAEDLDIDALREMRAASVSNGSFDSPAPPFLSSVRFTPPRRVFLPSRSPSPLLIASPRVIVPSRSISDQSRQSQLSQLREVQATLGSSHVTGIHDDYQSSEGVIRVDVRTLAEDTNVLLASSLLRRASHMEFYEEYEPSSHSAVDLAEVLNNVDELAPQDSASQRDSDCSSPNQKDYEQVDQLHVACTSSPSESEYGAKSARDGLCSEAKFDQISLMSPVYQEQNLKDVYNLSAPSAEVMVMDMRVPQGANHVLASSNHNASPSTGTPVEEKSRLHCRLCKNDPCMDVTATFCGHIFCYGCITREIIANSACPVCKTPTLLYCLFKLHLDS